MITAYDRHRGSCSEVTTAGGPSRHPGPCRRAVRRRAAAESAADFADYRLLRPLGVGGMGTVYLASRDDPSTPCLVALKVMNPGGSAERFANERRFLERLADPNVVRLLASGRTRDGRPYLAMEYVAGVPIDDYCDAHRLPVRPRLELFLAVARAVHRVHEQRLVHRDLKPSNILVTARGEPKLLDFGIAKPFDRSAHPRHTDRAELWLRMMTPAYASPEQITGGETTPASDVYSLGALLYKLLTGRPPHRSLESRLYRLGNDPDGELVAEPSVFVARLAHPDCGSIRELLRVSSRRSTRPRDLRRQLAGDLDAIALRALGQEPSERYVSARELAEDVARYLRGLPAEARRGTLGYRLARLRLRLRSALGTGSRYEP